ncbi:MAG: hypothetical protein LBG22_04955 [Treponema sp.]|jgi:hypothetical protein|nr:hypothetical protein [Treponema sp.]
MVRLHRNVKRNDVNAGIDLAKRSMEVCILDGDAIKRRGLKTDAGGRSG